MMIVRMFKVMPPPFDRGDVEEEYEEDGDLDVDDAHDDFNYPLGV